jgi:hypothetical protein
MVSSTVLGNDYTAVCGAAFEDLSHDEMMELDGGVSPTTISIGLSIATWKISAAATAFSASVGLSAFFVLK